ncbi:MAG TPA: nucleoside triphosphate pyrophosphatase, partial [Terriglobales bacterium]|nr:nucleoside triphosphate pyrophosphatase [Terriglobales bacterium]
MQLVLASASPRRRELLGRLGIPFDVVPSDVPEEPQPGEHAAAFAARLARAKAEAVARRFTGAVVLAADTIVVNDGVIYGKPRDRDDARTMLRRLAGVEHEVMTAVAVLGPKGLAESVVRSRVAFHPIDAADLEAYLDTAEPYDKAGAYALQGLAGRFVRSLEGSRSNVI